MRRQRPSHVLPHVYVYNTWTMAVVDKFQYKKLVLKRTPRVGDKRESKENSFWRKFKVRDKPWLLREVLQPYQPGFYLCVCVYNPTSQVSTCVCVCGLAQALRCRN